MKKWINLSMNENTQRLANKVAEESKLYCANPINPESEQFKFFATVLTEYIVKECVDICNQIYFNNYPDAEDFESSEEGDAIKNHFGIDICF